MSRLPREWIEHLQQGVSHRLGSSHADGRPAISRALASQVLPDGRLEVLFAIAMGQDLLDAVRATGRVA
jgi:hypothetical protein